jgi:hypothetical protein
MRTYIFPLKGNHLMEYHYNSINKTETLLQAEKGGVLCCVNKTQYGLGTGLVLPVSQPPYISILILMFQFFNISVLTFM